MKIRVVVLCLCSLFVGLMLTADTNIHRMMLGGRMLELAETRQITFRADGKAIRAALSPDGKYIAYIIFQDERPELRMIRSTGGQSINLLTPAKNQPHDEELPRGEIWIPDTDSDIQKYINIQWSPDGKLIALHAKHVICDGPNTFMEPYVLVFGPTGIRHAAFQLPETSSSISNLLWSPDGRRLAGFYNTAGDSQSEDLNIEARMSIFDLRTGAISMPDSRKAADVNILLDSWTKDGNAIRCVAFKGRGPQLIEISLDGKSEKVIYEDYGRYKYSPNGMLRLLDGEGVRIEDVLTGKVTDVLRASPGEFHGWSPNSKMLIYMRPEKIEDVIKRRSKILNPLWLVAMEDNPINNMCVALDSEENQLPTWSSDCLKMAYICEGRVYVAEMAWKDINLDDKLESGIPLEEEEEKMVLTNSAKQIGTALAMYNNDWDDQMPMGGNIMELLLPYVKNENVFFRPGTQLPIFQYFPIDPSQARRPAEAMVGMFDVGYGWQVILYLDGHVRVVPKK